MHSTFLGVFGKSHACVELSFETFKPLSFKNILFKNMYMSTCQNFIGKISCGSMR